MKKIYKLTLAVVVACILTETMSAGCGSRRVTWSVIGDIFSDKPYILTLIDPVDPPSRLKKFVGADLGLQSFEDIKFNTAELFSALKDFGKTPQVVVGQPYAVIAKGLGSDPFVHIRGVDCPRLFNVYEKPYNAVLLQVPPDSPNGMNPVRGHRRSGRGTIYMPMNVYRLGVVLNEDNQSFTRFEVRKGTKYKEDLLPPPGYGIDDFILSRDGLFIIALDTAHDAFHAWAVEDLSVDLVDRTGNSGFVQFPITINLDNVPGTETLPPVIEPVGASINPEGNLLGCGLSALGMAAIVDISVVADLPAIVASNDLDNMSRYSLAWIDVGPLEIPSATAFSPSGEYMVVLCRDTHSVAVVDVYNSSLVGTLHLGNSVGRYPEAVDFTSENGNETAWIVLMEPADNSSGTNGKVISLSLTDFAADPSVIPAIGEYEVGNAPRGIAIDTNYKYAVVSSGPDDALTVMDVEEGTVLPDTIPTPVNTGPRCVRRYNRYNTFYVTLEQGNAVMMFRLRDDGTLRKSKYVTGLGRPTFMRIQQDPPE